MLWVTKRMVLRVSRHKLEQLLLQQLARLLVHRAERFVHQDDFRIERQRARKSHALAHSSAQLVGKVVFEPVQPDLGNLRKRNIAPVPPRHPLELQPELDVAQHRAPRIEAKVLKYDRAVRTRSIHGLAVNQDATLVRSDKSINNAEQRRLAASAGTDDRDEIASCD